MRNGSVEVNFLIYMDVCFLYTIGVVRTLYVIRSHIFGEIRRKWLSVGIFLFLALYSYFSRLAVHSKTIMLVFRGIKTSTN